MIGPAIYVLELRDADIDKLALVPHKYSWFYSVTPFQYNASNSFTSASFLAPPRPIVTVSGPYNTQCDLLTVSLNSRTFDCWKEDGQQSDNSAVLPRLSHRGPVVGSRHHQSAAV